MRSLLALAGLLAATAFAAPTLAATFTVDDTRDVVDNNVGDGACSALVEFIDDPVLGPIPLFACTLRAAVQEANSDAGADTILLGTGVHGLTLAGSGEDAAADGDLDVTEDLSIEGTTTLGSQIDASAITESEPVFQVIGDAVVELSLLFVTGGSGGIQNEGSLTLDQVFVSDNDGITGGIVNDGGSVVATDSTIRLNDAALGTGGIANRAGVVILRRCTVSGNSGLSGGLDSSATSSGGATLIAVNSTISGNVAFETTFVDSLVGGTGGGIEQSESGNSASTTLRNVTISENHADVDGGGVNNASGSFALENSVIAGNTADTSGPDCAGSISSSGFLWLGSDSGCTFTAGSSDVVGMAADLGPLADNGGVSLTHMPVAGSGLIDGGDPTGCDDISLAPGDVDVTQDQRGEMRPFDGDGDSTAVCDIGAVEVQVVPSPSGPALAAGALGALALLARRRRAARGRAR